VWAGLHGGVFGGVVKVAERCGTEAQTGGCQLCIYLGVCAATPRHAKLHCAALHYNTTVLYLRIASGVVRCVHTITTTNTTINTIINITTDTNTNTTTNATTNTNTNATTDTNTNANSNTITPLHHIKLHGDTPPLVVADVVRQVQ
jgi:cobalamin-dependent methionine synthase I